jgi:uncharacterized repeat protein (TIGR01451 family)
VFVGSDATRSFAVSTNYGVGTLIIPMDTDTSPGHAAFNQNLGMWKAYGLIDKLLANGIPVAWAIKSGKTAPTDVDFTASSVRDKRTGTALGSWSYSGGAFIVDSAYATTALPIITAWWAANSNQPNVHEALAPFTADVNVTLRSPPRIAEDSVNAGIAIGYFNAAGIPDSTGKPWTTSSPGIFTEAQLAAGGLFTTSTACPQRKYDVYVTPHNGGYSYSLSDPTNLGTKAYSQLDKFVQQGGGWTATCHSILSNENAMANLTVNGTPAVQNLFATSLPGGKPGGFLTASGFPTIDNTGGTWTVDPANAGLPVAQAVPTAVATVLPGGSVQTWPSQGNPGAPTYWPHTERVGFFDTPTVDHDIIISGTYHDGTGQGKVTFIGGHSFPTKLPYSTNADGPFLRAFYNSLFFNGTAVAKVDLTLSPTTYPQNGTGLLSISITNTGGSTATSVGNASITLAPGFTYVSTSVGPAPNVSGQTLTWPGGLGDIVGGGTAVTIQVSVAPSVSGTLGSKQVGAFHATYGDVFGEAFTADTCRDVTISPTPAPTLTKTPSTQGPVAVGSLATWTLSYGNNGSSALLAATLQDTLPPGFSYVSSASSPSLPAPTVIPAPSGTIVRWSLGTLAAGTPAAGTVTITARAGAVTAGTGTPPQQTFTNGALLTGTDGGGTTFSASASANVVVQALDITLGKAVNSTFLSTLPGAVTYTLTPESGSDNPLQSVRVIDPLPAGITPPPTVGQGGTYGAYTPIAAVPGHDPGPPVLDTAMSVGSNFVVQGGSVTVTLNVQSSVAVTNVSPSSLGIAGGTASCTGPSPASQNVPAGGSGVNFSWTCTLSDLGEYVFSDDAGDAAGTTDWPSASSSSVLSAAAGGGPNVVTWTLGSNTPAVPGRIITSGFLGGIFAFRGANTTTFQKYDRSSNSWSTRAVALGQVKQGGSLTTDGVSTIFGLEGNTKQAFWSYNVAADAWTANASIPSGLKIDNGGAAQFLNVGGHPYVFALLGNSTGFERYDVTANTWSAMQSLPTSPVNASIQAGGALTTDGTNLYALTGNNQSFFFRYNVSANTWTQLANIPAQVQWGGSLTRMGNFIYAMVGHGNVQRGFYRYDLTAGTWSTLAITPGNVDAGGALTNDGTFIYAFQGKTTAFWRYDPSVNTWSTLAPFTANTDQGGSLVLVPDSNAQGRFTDISASRSLTVTGDTVTVTLNLTSSNAITNVVPGALTVTPANGASCSTLTGPVLTSPDNNITGTGDPVVYQWTCTVAPGAGPGSLTFSDTATGSGPVSFPTATSNSVIVSPPLTFSGTVPAGTTGPIVNVGLLTANGQTAGSQPVSTFIGQPNLTIVKSSSPSSATTLVPGDPITYTMVVQNTGVADATNVIVHDLVPSNTVFTSCVGGTTCGLGAGTVTWTIGTLHPGDTATVSFVVNTSTNVPISATPYTISNSATVTSTEITTPVVSNTVTNQLQVAPTIVKAVSSTEAATGDTLTYTIAVANPGAAFTGDVTDALPTGASFADNCVPACSFASGTVTWAGASIPPGTSTFSFNVTVTAAGGATVTNSATLDPSSPDLPPIQSNPVQTEIGPVLDIVKFNNPTGQVTALQTITYTLVVSNESNVTAHGVVVTDPVPVGTAFGSCTTPPGTTCGQAGGVVSWQLGDVPGGGSATVSFTVTVGNPPPGTFQIVNQAQATATNSSDTATSNPVYNPVPVPSMSLSKSALETSYSKVGDPLHYSYVVTNNSTTSTLVGPITVTDNKTVVTCPAGNIAPLAAMTCTATYAVIQADVDAGSVTNTATAHAGATSSNSAQATVSAAQSAALTILKTIASGDPYSAVGASIAYSYTVTNTGNVTLHNLAVSDDNVVSAPTCGKTILAPNESTTCTATHTVTQPDLDAGTVVNHARASALDTNNATVLSTNVTKTAHATQTPLATIVKNSNATASTKVGDVITFSFLVTNTGNVTVTSFAVTDPLPGLSAIGCGDITSLAPLASATCTATYIVTQADVDAGVIHNTATVNGQTATSGPVTASNTLSTPLTKTASVTLVKSSNATAATKVGDTVTFQFLVTNTGNVTITSFTVSDPLSGLSAISCGVSTLSPLASTTCTATYTVKQADVDAGVINNTATVNGQTAAAGPVTDTKSLSTPLTKTPGVTIVKSSNATATTKVGDTVAFQFLVTNTGNVTITSFAVADPLPGLSAVNCGSTTSLAPSASVSCSATYVVKQSDVDAGVILNTATVNGTTATAGPVTDSDTLSTPLTKTAAVTLVKTSNATSATKAGDTITYSFLVTNTGTVTITSFVVTDPLVSLSPVSCGGVTTLAPSASTTCTATYVVMQSDVDAGAIDNTATVNGQTASTGPVTATRMLSTPLTSAPGLTLVKDGTLNTAVVSPNGRSDAGDRIDYTLTATNSGNTTLTGVTVSDPMLGVLSCTPTQPATLAPGDAIVCTGSYTLTQADLDLGHVTNTATANSDQTAPSEATESIALSNGPFLTLVKHGTLDMTVVPPSDRADAGDSVSYTLTATNAGNVTLKNVTVTDPKLGPLVCAPSAPATLSPSEQMTCTGSYTLTQNDVNSGVVDNTATADSTQTGPVDTTEEVALTPEPALTVVKHGTLDTTVVAPANRADVGDRITYTITAANSGNTTLTGVGVGDPKLGSLVCAPSQPTTLQPGDELVCTGTYTLTQPDINAGFVDNTATAVSDQTPSSSGGAEVPVPQAPKLALAKQGTLDTNVVAPSGRADAGDRIDYTLTASNVGNVTLSGVTVSDPKLGVLSCAPVQPATLAPGAHITCTGSYTLVQGDLDSGSVENTATADSNQTPAVQTPATVAIPKAPALTLLKTGTLDTTVVAPGGRADVGDAIGYTLTATNTGNVTLTGVTISDPSLPVLSCAQPATLAPGAQLVCHGTHTLTQADLDAGKVDNTATAASDQTSPVTKPATVTIPRLPGLTLAKSGVLDPTVVAPATRTDAGDTITYTLTATNTGNVTLTTVEVADPSLGAISCTPLQPATLAPGGHMTCTGTHTVTQAEIDAGHVNNTALTESDQTSPTTATGTVSLPQNPALALAKDGNLDMAVISPSDEADVGDMIDYTLTAGNTGNTTLTNVTVTDPKIGALTCTPAQPATLAPGEKISCTGSYTLTQTDIDNGTVPNTATSASDQTQPTHASETVPVPQAPALTLEKDGVLDMTVVAPAGEADVGDKIHYTLTAANTGNVTLTNVMVTDPKLGTLVCTPTQPVSLAPGDSISCTGTYTLTQTDLNNGEVDNTATAVSDQTSPTQESETVDIPQSSTLTLVKHGTLDTTVAGQAARADAGDVVDYTLNATNNGNVTLTNVTVTDPKLGTLVCNPTQPASLAPGDSISCTGSYTITQTDLNNGSVHNTATASSDQTGSSQASNTVNLPQSPRLVLLKHGTLDTTVAGLPARADAGDVVNYVLIGVNAGNVTLTNLTVTDPTLGTLTCTKSQPATLAPGDQMRCTGSYTLTQPDLDNGSVQNTATASSDQVPSTQASATVALPQSPGLVLDKQGTVDATVVAPADRADAGDKVDYTLTASNVGNTTLTNVTVSDPKLGTLSCSPTQPATLAPGEKLECTGEYTLTQTDLNSGSVTNTATADSDQTTPFDAPSTVSLPQAPVLTLSKTGTVDQTVVPPSSRTDAGDEIHYTLTATNAGNVTLTGVTISDPELGTLACTQPATLAPGDQLVCTGTYTLTQVDINNGSVANTATADSAQTSSVDAPATVPLAQSPSLALVKHGVLDTTVVAPNNRADAGDQIDYTVMATNAGNVTLTGVTVADGKLTALDCVPAQPATLAPGAQIVCTGTHTLTQGDLDAGAVTNNATADSNQTPEADAPSTVTLPQAPALTLAKSGMLNLAVALLGTRADSGDTVGYTLTATNNGNVTLTGVTIVDPKVGSLACSPAQPASLAPGAQMTCTGTYTLTQADINAGHVDNIATADSVQTPPAQASSSVTIPRNPALTLVKTDVLDMTVVSPGTRPDAGDVVSYTLTATNSGNTTLTGVTVADPKLGTLSCTPAIPATLLPGAQVACTGSYTLTQADLDAGRVDNTGVADSNQTSPVQTPNEVSLTQEPGLTLAKDGVLVMTVVSPSTRADVGDRVNYTLTATNAGNVTLTGVQITDPTLGTLVCAPLQPATLAPGAQIVCTGSHTLTQADLDAGGVQNTATAGSDQTAPTDSEATVPLPGSPGLSLVKHVAESSYTQTGAVLHYTYVVTNTGNVSLPGPVGVNDNRTSVSCPAVSTVGNHDGNFDPGEQLTCSAAYTVVQSDLTAGRVTNTATATAAGVTSNPSSATVLADLPLIPPGPGPGPTPPGPTHAAIQITKSPTSQTVKEGGTATFTITVTNTGTASLTVAISDPLTSACARSGISLAPGASFEYSCARHNVQARLTNVATATGTAPDGQRAQASSSASVRVSPTLVTARSRVVIVKGPLTQTVAHRGVATFTITVANTGTIAAMNVVVTDPRARSCDRRFTSLRPGQSETYSCTSRGVTGGFANVATVTWKGAGGKLGGVAASRKVVVWVTPPPRPQHPRIAILKTPSRQTIKATHGIAGFRIVVRNTGDVVLHGVTVTDPQSPGCTKALGGLAPHSSTGYSCTSAPVTRSFTNFASVSGTSPAGRTVRDSAHAAVRYEPAPASKPKFTG